MAEKRKRRTKAEMAAARAKENQGTPPQDSKTDAQYVTKEQLDTALGGILDAIKNIAPAQNTAAPTPGRTFSVTNTNPESEKPVTPEDASASAANYTLNPAHQAIFEEYFDPKDGFEARFNYPYFEIIVPLKLSNADAAWKKYYKVDTRVKFIKYDNIEGGIREWCKMVAANLKYDRRAARK